MGSDGLAARRREFLLRVISKSHGAHVAKQVVPEAKKVDSIVCALSKGKGSYSYHTDVKEMLVDNETPGYKNWQRLIPV